MWGSSPPAAPSETKCQIRLSIIQKQDQRNSDPKACNVEKIKGQGKSSRKICQKKIVKNSSKNILL